MSLSPSSPAEPSPTQHGIRIIRAGSPAPQESLIKIKTRSERNAKAMDWRTIYPQLLLGQTHTTVIGVQRQGEFFKIRKATLDAAHLEVQRQRVQPALKKLRVLLEEIQNIALERGRDARISLLCQDGVLSLVERVSDKELLPKYILQRFEE